MPNFAQKSKAIGLSFWPKFDGLKKCQVLLKKYGYRLATFPKNWWSEKIGLFCPKSKAIGLPIFPKIEGLEKLAYFAQKVRL